MDEIQVWGFVFFLALVVWPILYVIVDRRHIASWSPERLERNTGKPLHTTGSKI